ncbi:tachykinin-4 [Ovis canadensis]|uniref:tachykinin-4 n=1 Tax=Ovis canadensis TaxID=37174 RepID=UPI003753826D
MLLCVTLLLLLGLSACTVAGDKKLAVDAEVGSWEDVIPSILLQLRDMKKGKASQFFGLMGKQVGGKSGTSIAFVAIEMDEADLWKDKDFQDIG